MSPAAPGGPSEAKAPLLAPEDKTQSELVLIPEILDSVARADVAAVEKHVKFLQTWYASANYKQLYKIFHQVHGFKFTREGFIYQTGDPISHAFVLALDEGDSSKRKSYFEIAFGLLKARCAWQNVACFSLRGSGGKGVGILPALVERNYNDEIVEAIGCNVPWLEADGRLTESMELNTYARTKIVHSPSYVKLYGHPDARPSRRPDQASSGGGGCDIALCCIGLCSLLNK